MSSIPVKKLHQKIDQCMRQHQFSLRRKLKDIQSLLKQNQPFDKALESLETRITQSLLMVQQRQQSMPQVRFDDALPISARREEISKAIAENQVVILAGETGSGKTTQIPKICLELGRGIVGQIGHTQPRRIAARTVASRIAEELSSSLGETVGYQVRFNDQVGENTLIKLMTDGILLADIQSDPYLNKYDTIIIDEAHERSLNIDFLLGYLKQLLPKRPDLKVIVTSATIDLEKFSEHFDNAPIIEVSGRTYPVEVRYRPSEDDLSVNDQVIAAIEEIIDSDKKKQGDILVFLSGEREIRELNKDLKKCDFPHFEVLPLYARLSLAEQNKVFNGHRGRRIVLATNVAETSITVPGIRYVVDPGYARISRYSYRTKVQRLPIEAVSQASANQRSGRCGRVSEGICIRLYSEEDFNTRPEFTDAEILRTNLASVILQMLHLRMGAIQQFPFIDSPDSRLVNDGFMLLQELGAVAKGEKLSATGRQLSRLPTDPRLARMLLASAEKKCLSEMLIVVSALSIQDPRERPQEKQQAADQKHREYWDDQSDFVAFVNLWKSYEEQRQALTQGQLRRYCQKNFLSYLRMREWRDLHHQLRLACRDLKLKENSQEASYEALHRSLLTGLLGNLGFLAEEREYEGARNRKFSAFPGSSQYKKKHKWIMVGELLETSKLFAHKVAKIDPQWAVDAAPHLLKYAYAEPHYDKRSGQVKAFQRVTLYGLALVERQRISYGKIDPTVSREVFIRAALVEGHYKGKGAFFAHNNQLLGDIAELESKSRRRDIMVHDQVLYDFFNERLPVDIVNLAGFEHWRKEIEQQQPKLLFLTQEQLMRHGADQVTEAQFPKELAVGGVEYPLSYHFEPNAEDDGVSIHVPVALLHQLSDYRLQWLVPGMIRDKCIDLIKGLPKQWRKHFVPVPAVVEKCLARMQPENKPLIPALAAQLRVFGNVDVPEDLWQPQQLDAFHGMNIKVQDDKGKVIDQSRDLATLRERYRERLQENLEVAGDDFERDNITQWDFDTLPEVHQLKQAGLTIRAYPALMDNGDTVSLKLMDNPQEALWHSRRGVVRLLLLQDNSTLKYLRKELLKGKDLGLTHSGLGKKPLVIEDMIMASALALYLPADKPIPRNEQDFLSLLAEHKGELVGQANQLDSLLGQVLKSLITLRKDLKTKGNNLMMAYAIPDMNRQLSQLLYPGCFSEIPFAWLQQYPRYFKAMQVRLDKVANQVQKDKMGIAQVLPYEQKLLDIQEKLGAAVCDLDTDLQQYRWMLQEWRVSLFAQSVKTQMPVSSKRLDKQWALVEAKL